MKKRFDLELIRVVCVVIVVIYHTTTRIYSSVFAHDYPSWFPKFMICLIWFAVPMFLFISGVLFNKKVNQKYQRGSYIKLIISKAKQLLVPYVIFSILLMLQGGWFSTEALLRGDFWHLWFLPTLFLCFAIYHPLLSRIRSWKCKLYFEILILTVSFVMSDLSLPDWLCWGGLHNFFRWDFYFMLGCVVANHDEEFRQIMGKTYLWIFLLFLWVFHTVFMPVDYWMVSWHNILAVSSALVSVYYLTGLIRPECLPEFLIKRVWMVGIAGMWIYIIHYWILIYSTSSKALTLAAKIINMNVNGLLILFVISMITFVLSYFITVGYFRIIRSVKSCRRWSG